MVWFKRAGWVIAVLLLIVGAAIAWLVGTTSGLTALLTLSSPQLQVERADGRLIGPLVLDGVRLDFDGAVIAVDAVAVEWRLVNLLRPHVKIDVLRVDGVTVRQKPASGEPQPLAETLQKIVRDLNELPVDITATNATVSEIVVTQDSGQVLPAHRLSIAGQFIDHRLTLSRAEIAGPLLSATLTGHADSADRGNVDLIGSYRVTVDSPLAEVAGEIRIDGHINHLAWRADLIAPSRLAVNGELRGIAAGKALLTADVQLLAFNPHAVNVDWPNAHLAGDVRLQSDLNRHRVTLNTRVTADALPATKLDGVVVVQAGSVRVEALQVGNDDGRVDIAGHATLQPELTWQLEMHTDGLDVTRYVEQSNGLATSGQLRVRGGATEMTADFSGYVEDVELGKWSVAADAAVNAQRFKANNLRLDAADGSPRSVVASGEFHFGAADLSAATFDASAQLSGFEWEFTNGEQLSDASGNVTLVGTAKEYDFTAQGGARSQTAGPITFSLIGQGDTGEVRIAPLEIDLLSGRTESRGIIAWRDDLNWDLITLFDGIDIGAIIDQPVTGVTGNVHATGKRVDDVVQTLLRIDALNAIAFDAPVATRGNLMLSGDRVTIEPLTIESRGAIAEISGSVGPDIALAWEVAIADIQSAVEGDIRGAVSGSGEITGTFDAPRVRAAFTMSDMTYGQTSLASAGIDMDVYPLSDTQSRISVDVSDVLAGDEFGVERGRVVIMGNKASHVVTLALFDTKQTRIDAEVVGELSGDQWSFESRQTQVDFGDRDIWQQVSNWHGRIGRLGALTLEDACLAYQRQQACIEFTSAQNEGTETGTRQIQSTLAITDIDLSLLNPYLRESGLSVSGVINGDMAVNSDSADRWAVNGQLRSRGGRLNFASDFGDEGRLRFNDLSIDVAQQQDIDVAVAAKFAGDGFLKAKVRISSDNILKVTTATEINGDFDVRVPNLNQLPISVLQQTDPEGELTLLGAIGGSLDSPRVELDAQLANAGFYVPETGNRLTGVNVRALTKDRQRIEINAEVNAGDGKIKAEGELQLASLGNPSLRINVDGDKASIIDLPEAKIVVSPQLSMVLKDERIDVNGSVVIDEAQLQIESTVSSITLSPDVVLTPIESDLDAVAGTASARRADAPAKASRYAVTGRVNLDFGKNSSVDVFGFSGKLEGEPVIEMSESGVLTGRGDIKIVDGEYDIYGRELPITKGILSYAGTDIDNPQINVEASKRVQGVTAGVRLEGSAKDPRVVFFSQPTLEDSDILSYLLFDRRADELSPTDALILVQLAAESRNPGSRGGGNLVRQISQGIAGVLGLNDLDIGVNTVEGKAAVVVGSQISSKLYLGYAVGVFEAAGQFILKYRLNDNWSFESNVGGYSGTDLKYEIER